MRVGCISALSIAGAMNNNNDSPEAGRQARAEARRSSLRVLAGLALILFLYVARVALIPIALALLCALLLSGAVEALHRLRVPRIAAAALLLLILVGAVGGAASVVWTPAQEWLASAPKTLTIIERKLSPLETFIRRLNVVANRAGKLASPAPTSATMGPPLITDTTSANVWEETRSALVTIVTVWVLALLLLAGGPPMTEQMCAALLSKARAQRVLTVIEVVRSKVARYYGVIALINLGLGVATTLVMALLNMPNPLLWGAMAAVFNFVPYVGSATTLAVLSVVAFVSFDDVGDILAVPASYLALATIEGQLVQPLLLGRQLELNPVLVFLALWFGGWLWGIAGIVLAVPSLVALKVAAEHSTRGLSLAAFLSRISSVRRRPSEIRSQ